MTYSLKIANKIIFNFTIYFYCWLIAHTLLPTNTLIISVGKYVASCESLIIQI